MSEGDDRLTLARHVGMLDGRVTAMEAKADRFEARIEKQLSTIEGKLDQLTTVLNLGRGGWRVVWVMGSLIAAIASLLGWVATHLFHLSVQS